MPVDKDLLGGNAPSLEPFIDAFFPRGNNCLYRASPLAAVEHGNLVLGPLAFSTELGSGSFTSFHQDGSGLVDSGHLVVSGNNDVVICRPCTDEEYPDAMKIIWGKDYFPGLEDMNPHNRIGRTCHWPTREIITELRAKGFDPKVFILKPGQLLYIPQACPHQFRKSGCQGDVPSEDAHYLLRCADVAPGPFLSIAWDFLLMDSTTDGKYLGHDKIDRTIKFYKRERRAALERKQDTIPCPLLPFYSLLFDKAKEMVMESNPKQPKLLRTILKVLLEQFILESKICGLIGSLHDLVLEEKERVCTGDDREDNNILTCDFCSLDTNTYVDFGDSDNNKDSLYCPSCFRKSCEGGAGFLNRRKKVRVVYRDMCLRPVSIKSQIQIDLVAGQERNICDFVDSDGSLDRLSRVLSQVQQQKKRDGDSSMQSPSSPLNAADGAQDQGQAQGSLVEIAESK